MRPRWPHRAGRSVAAALPIGAMRRAGGPTRSCSSQGLQIRTATSSRGLLNAQNSEVKQVAASIVHSLVREPKLRWGIHNGLRHRGAAPWGSDRWLSSSRAAAVGQGEAAGVFQCSCPCSVLDPVAGEGWHAESALGGPAFADVNGSRAHSWALQTGTEP